MTASLYDALSSLREVRCAGWLMGEWYHTEPEPE